MRIQGKGIRFDPYPVLFLKDAAGQWVKASLQDAEQFEPGYIQDAPMTFVKEL